MTMYNQDRLFNYKDGLFLRGISMFAFGLVALWYPGEGIETMITPFGILVLMNGLVTALVGQFFFSADSVLRVLTWRHGLLDLLVGASSLLAAVLHLTAFPLLLTLWLLATGIFYCFFSLRFIPPPIHPQLIRLGALHILLGGLYYVNHTLMLWDISRPVAIMAIFLGAYMHYILFQIRRVERNDYVIPQDSFPSDPFHPAELYQSSRH